MAVRAVGAIAMETRAVAAGMVAVVVAAATETTTTTPMLRTGLHLHLGDRRGVLAGARHGLA
jgi:hypothetical protein